MDTLISLGLVLLGLLLGLGLGGLIGVLWSRTRATTDDPVTSRALEQRTADHAVVTESLARLHDQLNDLARERSAWQGQLHQQVQEMRFSTETLRRETQTLSTALRKPQVRGRWGEMHLRRVVELAGLVERCDFSEQVQRDDGRVRPDLVVHLAGGRQVVVDAKVSLDAFLDATGADDEEAREHHLARHARQLRQHIDALGAKAYWRSFEQTPEFVVMFVPAEAFLSAALESEGRLLEHAAERGVVLATPTTLIALLRTVAQGWSHERLTEQAAEVAELGRTLHERLATMGGHLDQLGRSLGRAVDAYNSSVGSLEGRVLVTARQFGDLGVTDAPLEGPRQVTSSPRTLSAPEFAALGEASAPLSTPQVEELVEQDDASTTQLLPGLAEGPSVGPSARATARRVEGA
ncbi:MAG: DNA recombination protein RmuC [Nocardioides sp.]|uniref:DNA recombination protein RmuC n=1 Tax=Nocardioides sp. TaxID=35761 RepID=UPI003F093E3D